VSPNKKSQLPEIQKVGFNFLVQPAVAPRTRDCGWGRTRRRTASGGAMAGKVELAGRTSKYLGN